MKKVISTKRLVKHTNGKDYFVLREVIDFFNVRETYVIRYKETLVDKVETKDKRGKDEEKEETTIVLHTIKTFPEQQTKMSKQEVDHLFLMLKEDIVHTQSFTNQFQELQVNAMLVDTLNQNAGKGRFGTKEWELWD